MFLTLNNGAEPYRQHIMRQNFQRMVLFYFNDLHGPWSLSLGPVSDRFTNVKIDVWAVHDQFTIVDIDVRAVGHNFATVRIDVTVLRNCCLN